MNALELVLGFDISHPPGLPRSFSRSAWERAYSPLLRELEERDGLPVSLHVSGAMLDFLESERPEGIERLRRLVSRGQVEVLASAYYGPVLSAIPERDGLGQLRLAKRRHQHLLGTEPEGVVLPYGAWEPSLPRLLARMGMRFAVLDARAFRLAGLAGDQVDGHFMAEREGHCVALFPDLAGEDPVGPTMDPSRVLGLLRRYSMRRRRAVVWMIDARELGVRRGTRELSWGRSGGWLPRLLGRFVSQDHWLKLSSFSSLLRRYRSAGRVYLPACMDPALQASAVVPPNARDNGTCAPVSSLSGRDARRAPATLPWESFLARYPEANRLHKRMLVTSREVARLTSHVRQASRRPGGTELARGLERALLWLYQAQSASPLTHDPWGGLHSARLRHRAYAALLRAELQVRKVMGESGRFTLQRVDTDCDGRDEVVVTTPYLRAVLDPARGGSMVELDVFELGANVLNTLTRRCERVHAALSVGDDLPVLVSTAGVSATGVAAVFPQVKLRSLEDEDTEETPLDDDVLHERLPIAQLAIDRAERLSFVEHFLSDQATVHNLERQQHPEVGDFSGAEYQLMRAEAKSDRGVASVHLARDGSISEGGSVRLLRVVKNLVFQRDTPGFEVTWELCNRSPDPLETVFAVELNLNIDASGERSVYLHVGDQPCDPGEVGSAEGAQLVAWGDLRRAFRLTIALEQPARVWHYPVHTISEGLEGHTVKNQGLCLVLSWPLRLWGLERQRIGLTVHLGSNHGVGQGAGLGVAPRMPGTPTP